jgi:hypothetical protein
MKKSNTLLLLILEREDVNESVTALAYFSKLTQARADNQITWKQYFLLNDDFYLHCQRNKIESPKSLPLFIKTIG